MNQTEKKKQHQTEKKNIFQISRTEISRGK